MSGISELREQYRAKGDAIAEVFKQAGKDLDFSKVTTLTGDTSAKLEQLGQMETEAGELKASLEKLRGVEDLATKNEERQRWLHDPVNGLPHPPASDDDGGDGDKGQKGQKHSIAEINDMFGTVKVHNLGRMFAEHEVYKRYKDDASARYGMEFAGATVKTLFSESAGYAPQNIRSGRLELLPMRRPLVASFIPSDTTTQSAVVYMEETTFTNNADTVAEGGTKPESALGYTQRTIPVEVIATWLPVTRQQMEDVTAVEALINQRLTLMIQLTEEFQLLNGSGVSPDLIGFYNKPNVQTQAKGADPTPDAFYKAITKVQSIGFADPTAIVMHPNDWQDIRLLRTLDGLYIWGSPALAGPQTLWGYPVIATTAATEGTGLTGDFQLYSHISRREGIRLDVSDSHSDFFIKNQLAIRIEERISLEIYRAEAFCLVTGI